MLKPLSPLEYTTSIQDPAIFDIEADTLDPERCWCVCVFFRGTMYRFSLHEIPKVFKILDEAGCLVAHNGSRYDIPALHKLYGWSPKVPVVDTLVWSRYLYADRREQDQKLRTEIPKKLRGSHSLGAWGVRLGTPKSEFNTSEGISEWSPELVDYCEQDVVVNKALLEFLESSRYTAPAGLLVEYRVNELMELASYHGVPFDRRRAEELSLYWGEKAAQALFELQLTVEPRVEQLKTKKKIHLFNPNSPVQRLSFLKPKGWKPLEYNKDTGSPKVTLESLTPFLETHPEVRTLKEYLVLNKRLSQLAVSNGKGVPWLQAVQDDGKIHGSFIHIGAVNHRLAHAKPNLAQVPRVSSPYGAACRSLFHAPEGWKLLGTDAKGLEQRTLANRTYLWDQGALAKIVLEGDFHENNRILAGLDSRDDAKTLIYALTYGAGNNKLGTIVGGNVGDGAALRARFESRMPAFAELLNWVRQQVSMTGYVPSLDGRRIYIRSAHSALNTLLAGDGIVIIKWAMCRFWKRLQDLGLVWGEDYAVVLQAHDEWQTLVRDPLVDTVKHEALESLRWAGEKLNVRLPIEGDVKVGNDWAETH